MSSGFRAPGDPTQKRRQRGRTLFPSPASEVECIGKASASVSMSSRHGHFPTVTSRRHRSGEISPPGEVGAVATERCNTSRQRTGGDMKQAITIDHEPARVPDLDARSKDIRRKTLELLARFRVGALLLRVDQSGYRFLWRLGPGKDIHRTAQQECHLSRMLARLSGPLTRLIGYCSHSARSRFYSKSRFWRSIILATFSKTLKTLPIAD